MILADSFTAHEPTSRSQQQQQQHPFSDQYDGKVQLESCALSEEPARRRTR